MTNKWNVSLDENGALRDEEAYKLFNQGASAWNDFMEQYPETDVDFSHFDFSRYYDLDKIDFSGFQFPKETSFAHTNFGNNCVLFVDVKIGDDYVSFEHANFGYGDISFDFAQFGNGNISFYQANFSNGNVSFIDTTFGKGKIVFNQASFGDGNVSFRQASFGDGGEVSFEHASFGDGKVSFEKASFGDGNVSFHQANFGTSEVWFKDVEFGNGKVLFNYAKFDNGSVSFYQANFGSDEVSFSNTKFGGCEVIFRWTKFSDCIISFNNIQCESLDFSYSSFAQSNSSKKPEITFSMERAHISQSLLLPNLNFRAFSNVTFRGSYLGTLLDIEGCRFSQLPDLTATTINGHFSVDRLHVDEPKQIKESDSTKARRLKELAKKAEDRQTQLDMLAFELDAMTATKQIPFLSRLLNRIYKLISNYGRSISRPFLGLILVWAVCGCVYIGASETESPTMDAFQLSFSQSLPFLSWSRTVKETSLMALYDTEKAKAAITQENSATGQNLPLNNDLLENVGLIQNLFSYILLFFLGLGIRNRFKL
ncbi:hypothetical protein CBF23_008715 [Marinomonas agarivorans]|nr:hypothetical protein CBF23_008715 [Marinomonas agarivorans]